MYLSTYLILMRGGLLNLKLYRYFIFSMTLVVNDLRVFNRLNEVRISEYSILYVHIQSFKIE